MLSKLVIVIVLMAALARCEEEGLEELNIIKRGGGGEGGKNLPFSTVSTPQEADVFSTSSRIEPSLRDAVYGS